MRDRFAKFVITIGQRMLSRSEITLPYEVIDPRVDEAFAELLTAFFTDETHSFKRLSNELLADFEKVGIPYLFNHNDLETTRKYFKNLRFIWSAYFNQGRWQDAERFIERVLEPIVERENKSGILIHKGPMYYFWGGTAILKGELDKGFLLMHSSYEEDLRVSATQPTPSTMFVALTFDNPNQFFGQLVEQLAGYLEPHLKVYRGLLPSQITMAQFRQSFLDAHPNVDAVFVFTHTAARLRQLSGLSHHVLQSDFAGQYEINLLFDLVLVIDSSIKAKHPSQAPHQLHMPDLIDHLSRSLGWQLTSGHLTGQVHPDFVNLGFDTVTGQLLDRTYPFNHSPTNLALESDMCICYLLRNRGAHDPSSSQIVINRWREIAQSLFNVIFLTSETLYP